MVYLFYKILQPEPNLLHQIWEYMYNLFGCCYCDNVLVSAKLFPLKLELKCTCVNRQNVLLLLK